MITARNYAAQAERGLTEMGKYLESKKRMKDSGAVEFFAKKIKDSVHFAVPDNGVIIEGSYGKGLSGLPARLPFPCITIEYYSDGAHDQLELHREIPLVHVPRRIILAIEHENFGANGLGKGIAIFCSGVYEGSKQWTPCSPFGFFLLRDWDSSFYNGIELNNAINRDAKGTKFAGAAIPFCADWFEDMARELGRDSATKNATLDIASEVSVVVGLLEALACSNVSGNTLLQKEPPNSVASKRRSKGKLPIYETRILTITNSTNQEERNASGSTHQSPRTHLRRGHIRRLDDQRRVWVNACVVGKAGAGIINKQYRVNS